MDKKQLPNILLITAHDLGRFLGCYGVDTVQTPHINQLAADGCKFTNAFAAAPLCSPARAALHTGRYPHSNGVMGLTHGNFAWDLNSDEQHIASICQQTGYRTALIGVHHESRRSSAQQVKAQLGFDIFEPSGRGETVTETACRHIQAFAQGDKPFYMQVGYNEVHRVPIPNSPRNQGFADSYFPIDRQLGTASLPYLIEEPSAEEELAELQGSVAYLDTCVGTLLHQIDQLELTDDTVVIFTTDHGLAFPRAKCSLYDAGIEIALLMRYPKLGWSGGRQIHQLISAVDLVPTLRNVLALPEDPRVQGTSLYGLLNEQKPLARDAIFAEMTYHRYYDPRRCIRTDQHKLILNFSSAPEANPTQSWRPRVMPVTASASHDPIELYDLTNDPNEFENVAHHPAYKEIQADLLAQLHRWMVDTEDPLLEGPIEETAHGRALRMMCQEG